MAEGQRSAWISIPLIAVLFLGSGAGGVLLADTLAPDSILAGFVGLLALPLGFLLGMQFWLGFALLTVLLQTLRRLLAGGGLRPGKGSAEVPPGAYAFVFTSLATSLVGGVLIGTVATQAGFLAVVVLYALIGSVYGSACWWLARAGFLPFPDG